MAKGKRAAAPVAEPAEDGKGSFTVPAGYVPVSPVSHEGWTRQTLDDGKELWLLRLPPDLSAEDLSGLKLRMDTQSQSSQRLGTFDKTNEDEATATFTVNLTSLDDAWETSSFFPLLRDATRPSAYVAGARFSRHIVVSRMVEDTNHAAADEHRTTEADAPPYKQLARFAEPLTPIGAGALYARRLQRLLTRTNTVSDAAKEASPPSKKHKKDADASVAVKKSPKKPRKSKGGEA